MNVGYIVFDDEGRDPLSYGASEKWFPNYDDALAYAMDIVKEKSESYEKKYDPSSVMIYEGEEELMHQSHNCPCGRVVFEWSNYHRPLR